MFLPFLFVLSGNIQISVVYNNYPFKEGLKTSWGFSAYIKGTEKHILFDTGGDGDILLYNMQQMLISPDSIDIVFLSHIHSDHTGGLWGLIEKNINIIVYLPKSFPKDFKERLKKKGIKFFEVSNSIQICKDVYSTGELGAYIKEQSLIILTDKGLIIITGCAHPGIVNIVKYAKERYKKNVFLVMGGFHLIGMGKREILNIAKDLKGLGVKYVAPSHCSGDVSKIVFKTIFGKHYIESGVGKVISLGHLK